ncbi:MULTISPECIES: hypothetical protein [unclassified Lysinibacillus]|uniref:hypothetical protein n=1 Tax=unclassified Lysinibacillus TaxID=2636778 RepID=UPI002011ED59|nr:MULTISPECIES: hypothetical protein [unclassified Lysinibacillus]MCL1696271.1 hypothetical protein [Lysinibacillus sp. BPa_S21]MCL1700833.1 hypothetical protein [Lysinibacillus sp. Bpr_S20]
MSTDKEITCCCCGNIRKIEEFYSSSSYFMKNKGRVHTCKKCLWEYVIPDDKVSYDINKVKEVLLSINRPYMKDIWNAAENESLSRDTKSDIFKLYMKNLGMKDFRDLTWDDSDFDNKVKKEASEQEVRLLDEEDYIYSPEEIKKMKRVWGNNFAEQDFIFLENFYGEYENNFPTDTPAQINIYRNLAKIHLQAEKELEKGNIKSYKDLMDLSSKMHNDGNIKPIQSSGMNDDKGVSTYGMWIKTIENDEPCEYFENKKTYEDYDYFRRYIEKWFVRPFKNIFNISKDFDVKDDK